MSLSKYLVEHNAKLTTNKTLEELKQYNRQLTFDWIAKNKEFEAEIKAGFHTLTSENYNENRTEILNGYADHYAEKIFGFSAKIPQYLAKVGEAPFNEAELKEIKEAVKKQNAIPFIGHLGGMEFIPPFLALHGIPVTVILRFNSTEARKRAFEQNARLKDLDITLIDASDNMVAELLKLKGQKRLLITVYDGFDNWKPDVESVTMYWGLKKIKLDSTPRRLYNLTQKGSFFYISMLRNDDKYKFSAVKLEKGQSHTISEVIYKPWKASIEENFSQWYIWDEVREIKNR